MAHGRKTHGSADASSANLGFEAKLWLAAEYKHVALGLIFLKYLSDSVEQFSRSLISRTESRRASVPLCDAQTREQKPA